MANWNGPITEEYFKETVAALDRAQELAGEIISRFDCAELFITEFTPAMGVHTGPGVVGVAFYNGD